RAGQAKAAGLADGGCGVAAGGARRRRLVRGFASPRGEAREEVSAKPLIRLESAQRDERDAVAYYAREAGLDIALSFSEALRAAYRAIVDRPQIGSPRYGDMLG